jgi:lactobin A/cerein 7B family class IIb bacteriocin
MNEKFNSVACETLSQQEVQETSGGFIILFLAAISTAEILLVGTAIVGAYKMGYDKACGC